MRTFKQYLTEAVLPTQNDSFGFFGTMSNYLNYDETKKFWNIASTLLQKELGWRPETVRTFLDGKGGRYFADSVIDAGWNEAGLKKALQQWKSKNWFDSYKM